jgi:hypothetical protein
MEMSQGVTLLEMISAKKGMQLLDRTGSPKGRNIWTIGKPPVEKLERGKPTFVLSLRKGACSRTCTAKFNEKGVNTQFSLVRA